jgi:hypothetical protein
VTIKELIECLSELPPDAEIQATWEGIERPIFKSGLWQHPSGIVLLNAEGNEEYYRKGYESGAVSIQKGRKV